MNRLSSVKLIPPKRFICAILIGICLLTASLALSRVQASGLFASDNQNVPLPASATDESNKRPDADVSDQPEEQEASSSDPPGSTEQNHSTGDELLLRPPR